LDFLTIDSDITKMVPTVSDLAYIAGFFDGEGYVAISKHDKTKKWNQLGFTLIVVIGQVNPFPLIFIRQFFGGHLRRENAKGNKRAIWMWTISSKTAYDFLQEIYPYLKVKKDECNLAFQFQNTIGNSFAKLTDETIELRTKMYEEMKKLKTREY